MTDKLKFILDSIIQRIETSENEMEINYLKSLKAKIEDLLNI